ncbi:hypothetical protein DFS34DRAFT_440118 [Phlyctochytrium arcticum]|nr:hypothetical protein DFS34DRAFT_440118 [Phlyctochytrium arcticum]
MDTDISHVSNSSHSPRLVQPQGPFLMQPPMTPNTPSTCNPVPSANVLTSAADMEFSHKRTPSTQSEPDMALDRNDTFFTPQAKLVKPNPAAFHSTGLLSRKNRPRMTGHTMPETPLKKQFPYPPFRAAGTGGLLQKQHRLPGNSPFDLSLDHSNSTPARELLGSVRSKHNRSPFAETPVKNAKKVHLDSGFGHPSHLVDMTPQPPVRSFWQAISQESDSLTPQHPSIQPWPAGGESGLQSPASTRTRTRSQSSPPVQTSSLFQSRSGLFSSQIKRRPSASSTAIEDVFSASPGTTSKGLFGHATSKTNDGDMMDCDDGDPDIALEIHHRRSYSNLITGYPVFLTVGSIARSIFPR